MLTSPKYYSPGDPLLLRQGGEKGDIGELDTLRHNVSQSSFAELLKYAPNAPPQAGRVDYDGIMASVLPPRGLSTKEELADMPREKAADKVIPTYEQPPKRPQRNLQHGDPRFIGKINQLEVQRNYAFIGELRREELKECDAQYRALSEDTPEEKREALRMKLLKLKRQVGEMERRKAEEDIREKLVKAELRAIVQGKRPDFIKDRDIKRLTSESLYCASAGTRKGDRRLQKARRRQRLLTL
ncbi:hypothetical protein GL50803_0033809 [Giardia duodenalis]|uniref:rRNA biogenesis protein RRP36 n=1 Tax=Giardia intestinalis (strain ATCC 50803 / WB clone C6) TaxID=184922 RepID=A8BQT2_GIAIC|nr:hypothetical protein GL50803_0033809 [Giardia intestinalis]KAE8304950.1 hypothetical protein GL50803_0033809 [Giardia intestinalis]|eukprot:XP_001705481.1 Hypothetical protein GL50803_33809 [Giardia lamblia ATCC 50803]